MLCDVNDRIGGHAGQNGAQEIKAHPFFRGVRWDGLRDIHAPFKPELKGLSDTSYFPINEIPQEDNSQHERAQVEALSQEHSADMALPFIGYTFKRFEGMRT